MSTRAYSFLLRLCEEAMQKALGESADIRKLAISLKAVEYGGQLTQELLKASQSLEKMYEDYITVKTNKKKKLDKSELQVALDKATLKLKWVAKAKVLGYKNNSVPIQPKGLYTHKPIFTMFSNWPNC